MTLSKGFSKKVADHVWLINDGSASCYLVVGQEKAAIIDTMNGYMDVLKEARKYTELPLLVINTHGHGDHIFGNIYFDEAWLTEEDLPMAEESFHWPEFEKAVKRMRRTMPGFKLMKAGDVFDLGGLTLTVIACPGHTPGSVLLLLNEDRILFTGDAINRHTWMQLQGCSTIREYRDTLKGLLGLHEKADVIWHGHATVEESIDLLDEELSGFEELLATGGEGDELAKWSGGTAYKHLFGTTHHEILYHKERIQ